MEKILDDPGPSLTPLVTYSLVTGFLMAYLLKVYFDLRSEGTAHFSVWTTPLKVLFKIAPTHWIIVSILTHLCFVLLLTLLKSKQKNLLSKKVAGEIEADGKILQNFLRTHQEIVISFILDYQFPENRRENDNKKKDF